MPKVVVGITPVLAEQLADPTFQDEFKGYLKNKVGAAREDAELRLREHYEDFMRLYGLVKKRARGVELHVGDWEFLGDCERRDNLFPDIDVGWWA